MADQISADMVAVLGINFAFGRRVVGHTLFADELQQLALADSAVGWARDHFHYSTPLEYIAASMGSLLSNFSIREETVGPAAFEALRSALVQIYQTNPSQISSVVVNVAMLLTQLEGNATYGIAATSWNRTLAKAYDYSSDVANTREAQLVRGTDSNDQLYPESKSTAFIAGAGNDTLHLGNQANVSGGPHTPGPRDDIAYGGAGADKFMFFGYSNAELLQGSTGASVTAIRDFHAGEDKILLWVPNLLSGFQSISLADAQATSASSAAEVWSALTPVDGGTSFLAKGKLVTGVGDHAWLYVDNSNGVVDRNADMLVEITGYSGTLSASDFGFVPLPV